MKKLVVVAIAAAMVFGGTSMVLAKGAGTGIVGSPHDFSDSVVKNNKAGGTATETWNTREEICRVCHAPHDKGRTTYQNGLLWNRGVSAATFTMYDSSSLDGTMDASPSGNTKLCLACHDGTIAYDTYDSHAGGAATLALFNNSSLTVSKNLQGTHPVSVTYDAVADTNLHDPTVATWTDGSTVASTLQDGKVQCSTCHDVHDKNSVASTALLRKVNTSLAASGGSGAAAERSALCLTCHAK